MQGCRTCSSQRRLREPLRSTLQRICRLQLAQRGCPTGTQESHTERIKLTAQTQHDQHSHLGITSLALPYRRLSCGVFEATARCDHVVLDLCGCASRVSLASAPRLDEACQPTSDSTGPPKVRLSLPLSGGLRLSISGVAAILWLWRHGYHVREYTARLEMHPSCRAFLRATGQTKAVSCRHVPNRQLDTCMRCDSSRFEAFAASVSSNGITAYRRRCWQGC